MSGTEEVSTSNFQLTSIEKTPEQTVEEFKSILESDPNFKIESPCSQCEYGLYLECTDDNGKLSSTFITKNNESYLGVNERTQGSYYISHLYPKDFYGYGNRFATIINFLHSGEYSPNNDNQAFVINDRHDYLMSLPDDLYGNPIPIISVRSEAREDEREIIKILKSAKRGIELVLSYESLSKSQKREVKDRKGRVMVSSYRNPWDSFEVALSEINMILDGKKKIILPNLNEMNIGRIRFEHPYHRMPWRY